MAIEDTHNGAKNAFTLMDAYMNTVAEEIGMERALALMTKMVEQVGSLQGMMTKEQAGTKDFDAKAAHYSLVNTVSENLGIVLEVLEESPERVSTKCRLCSIYEAGKMLGWDDKFQESECRTAGAIRFVDTAVKQLNPKLSYRLKKFRSGADDFCEEELVLS